MRGGLEEVEREGERVREGEKEMGECDDAPMFEKHVLGHCRDNRRQQAQQSELHGNVTHLCVVELRVLQEYKKIRRNNAEMVSSTSRLLLQRREREEEGDHHDSTHHSGTSNPRVRSRRRRLSRTPRLQPTPVAAYGHQALTYRW